MVKQWVSDSIQALDEKPEIVRPGKVVARRSERRLQRLLDRLLSVETDNCVGNIDVDCQLLEDIGILLSLAQKEPSFFELRP